MAIVLNQFNQVGSVHVFVPFPALPSDLLSPGRRDHCMLKAAMLCSQFVLTAPAAPFTLLSYLRHARLLISTCVSILQRLFWGKRLCVHQLEQHAKLPLPIPVETGAGWHARGHPHGRGERVSPECV